MLQIKFQFRRNWIPVGAGGQYRRTLPDGPEQYPHCSWTGILFITSYTCQDSFNVCGDVFIWCSEQCGNCSGPSGSVLRYCAPAPTVIYLRLNYNFICNISYMPGPFSCIWGYVYMMFPTVWQLFRSIWQWSLILSTGTNGNSVAPKLEFYL
jgi:hypothetical protein